MLIVVNGSLCNVSDNLFRRSSHIYSGLDRSAVGTSQFNGLRCLPPSSV